MQKAITTRFTTLFSVSLLSLAVLSGCSKPADSGAEKKAEAKPAGADSAEVIKVATEGAYRPFNFVDKEGNPVGFDVDITNALCEEMKAKCEIVTQDWDGIIPGLIAKKYDAIVAGMSITPERQEKVDFTAPYFKNSLIYLAKKDAQVDVTALSGKKIAAQAGTVAAQYIEDNLASNNEVKTYKTQEDAYSDLKAGRVELMFSDIAPAQDWMKSEEGADFEQKGDAVSNDDQFGIAVRKGDELKAKFDTALATLKENGKYQELYDQYFK